MDIDKTLRDLSLLTARLALGGSIAAHGAQKLFGVMGGPGPDKAAQMMRSLGFPDHERVATMASATELTSGSLIALGAMGPLGPAMLATVMLVAIETVHRPKGYFNTEGGFEMNTMYIALALLLANHGYGAFSVDELTGLGRRMRPMYGWLGMAGAIGAALMMLAQRETQPHVTRGETPAEEQAKSPA
ncbi:MAG TPA: DoxX family protein [Candidatus Baltobacteraceae bacterium]|nr:DoxX family protein [Candidatus Baltobacteraceae bacterium]